MVVCVLQRLPGAGSDISETTRWIKPDWELQDNHALIILFVHLTALQRKLKHRSRHPTRAERQILFISYVWSFEKKKKKKTYKMEVFIHQSWETQLKPPNIKNRVTLRWKSSSTIDLWEWFLGHLSSVFCISFCIFHLMPYFFFLSLALPSSTSL